MIRYTQHVARAITRLEDSLFKNAATGAWTPGWLRAISVRAVSDIDPPTELERLNYSAYLFAFMSAWRTCKKSSDTDASNAFFEAARRVRVKFLFLPADDDANRSKWALQEKSDAMADNTAVLVGYKRCVGVATVQGSLKDKGVAHDAAAVASWFVSIPWNSSSDKITAKVAANYLRIHGRLTPKIMGILDQAESTFGRRHALTAVTTLEVLCSKTSVQSSVGLQDTLLEYVFDGVYVDMFRGTLPHDTGRDSILLKFFPKMLLVRRVVLWLGAKFRYNMESGSTYATGYSPGEVVSTLFKTWTSFHKHYPAGKKYSDVGDAAPCSLAFLAKLPESLIVLIDFIKTLMELRADIDATLGHALHYEQNISAETFFERRQDLVQNGIFDLASFTEALLVVHVGLLVCSLVCLCVLIMPVLCRLRCTVHVTCST